MQDEEDDAVVVRRPAKNRQKKVIDDEDDDIEEEVPEDHKSPQKTAEGTEARRTAMHSEVTSSHALGGGKDDDGSVKSLKR